MGTRRPYEITDSNLSDDQFTVEQTWRDENFRPASEARDAAGKTIFGGTYQTYQEKDGFPFVDANEDEVITVKASGTWDVAGDHLLTDSRIGNDLVILDDDFFLLRDTWRIRDADDETLLAESNSRGALFTVGRKFLPFNTWLAHKYDITDPDDNPVGSIESEFAVFGIRNHYRRPDLGSYRSNRGRDNRYRRDSSH